MPRLYMVTVPGLDVKSDWQQVHDCLLSEFPDVTDVLATTIPETVLIVYEGRADIDAWLEAVTEATLLRRIKDRARRRTERPLERVVGLAPLGEAVPTRPCPLDTTPTQEGIQHE